MMKRSKFITFIALFNIGLLLLPDAEAADESTVSASVDKTTATITWQTDENSSSQVDYWDDEGDGGATIEKDTDGGVTSHSVIVTGLKPNTTYTYHVRSRNATGLTVSDAHQFITLQGILIFNVEISKYSETSPTISWETDVSSYSRVEYATKQDYESSGELGSFAEPSPNELVTSHSVQLSGLQENKAYYFRVKSDDGAGKEGVSAIYELFTDITEPTISNFTITPMSEGNEVNGQVSIQVSAADNTGGLGIKQVLIMIDAEDHALLTETPYTVSWDTTAAVDGDYIVSAIAADFANNAASQIIEVVVDNQAPTVSILSPTPGQEVTGILTIQVEANDGADNAPERVEIYIDDLLAVTFEEPSHDNIYEYDWDSTLSGYGTAHTVFAKAYDNAGNEATTGTINFVVQNPLKGIVSVFGTATDVNNFDLYILECKFIGDPPSEWETIVERDYQVEDSLLGYWDTEAFTSIYGNGDYKLRLTVSDKAGNVASDEVQVQVDNSAP